MIRAVRTTNGLSASGDIRRRPRSIIILTPWFPNRPDDRKFTYIYDSAAALARRGVAVHVLVCRPFAPRLLSHLTPEWMRGAIEPAAFEDLASLSVISYPGLPRRWLNPLTNYLSRRRICAALTSLALKSGANLIHVHTEGFASIASAVAADLRLPSVVTVHGLNTDPDFLDAPAQQGVIRCALAAANRVIFVGGSLLPFFAKLVGRDDHFRVVHNGARFPTELGRTPILCDSKPIRFISVSNLHEGKGVDITLRALAMARDAGFSNWHYTIVGDGSEQSALVDLARSLGLAERVRFEGSQLHKRVYELLGESDVFVLPSYREAFGIAYLEAMASGLVAIGVRGQGPEAFIEHGKTGFLVEPRSAQSLADCILNIAANRENTRRIGKAGDNFVRKAFTWDAHASKLIDVYQELVGCACAR